MDIFLTTTLEIFQNLLQKKSFVITQKHNHFSAMLSVSGGRYHILYLLLQKKVFIDFHFDNTIHGIGMGADYGKKPEQYFDLQLKRELDSLGILYEIYPVNWFTRKNKAIITGFRL